MELIIINNNSTDSTKDICHEFILSNPHLNVKYFEEKFQGLSFARNRGIRESTGELVTFIDDDSVLAEDFCEKIVGFFRNHENVNAAGGKILLKHLGEKPGWLNPFMASLLGYFNKGSKSHEFRNDYFRGSNMIFKKTLFDRYEPFNTSLGRVGRNLAGSEEKEIFYRLKSGGESLWYIGDAVVFHLVPSERTSMNFIRAQAVGAGKSQREMTLQKGKKFYIKSLVFEICKWPLTISLSLIYLIILRYKVSAALIIFRWYVSLGLFSGTSGNIS